MLTIILTSYNRPLFVAKAIESVKKQTSDQWQLIVIDDGSNKKTVDTIKKSVGDHEQITAVYKKTKDSERGEKSRYAVLINEVLPNVKTPLVMYMCDNVEYDPDMVKEVVRYFDSAKGAFAGYILQARDVWTADGKTKLGHAQSFGHWPEIPMTNIVINNPRGNLDHSQVIHRLPINLEWDESIDAVKSGDAFFFESLVKEYGGIRPIMPGKVLSYEHIPK